MYKCKCGDKDMSYCHMVYDGDWSRLPTKNVI